MTYKIGRLRGGFCVCWRDGGKRRRLRLKARNEAAAMDEARILYLSLTAEPEPSPDIYDLERHVRVEVIRQVFDLDVVSGLLTWRERGLCWFGGDLQAWAGWNARYAGSEALGHINQQGYKEGCLFGVPISAHRVVFCHHNGRWPDLPIDHADGVKTHNWPSNLREASTAQNARNRGGNGGSSRFKGVSWNKRAGKWEAYCTDHDGRLQRLGYFTDEAEAARAYDAAASNWHDEFARLNFPG